MHLLAIQRRNLVSPAFARVTFSCAAMAEFKAGIYDGPDRMKARGLETTCAMIFYGAHCVQVVMSFVVIGSQNVTRVTEGPDGYSCPDGYLY